jgi:thiol-disulfide isomerase/thioredoxin
LVTDSTPDVPLRTSDVYLERLISEGAAARGLEFNGMADLLLAQAWRDRTAWEPQIRLLDRIGNAFGVFSPRSFGELEDYSQQLPELIQKMKTYARRWKMAMVSVKGENLRSFLKQNEEWSERLRADVLKAADALDRKQLLEELLPRLEDHARARPELWGRLEMLRDRAQRASEGRWRLDVRRAAILRLRVVLIQIAGRSLLALGPDAMADTVVEQQAFDGLLSCEALEPGNLPASPRAGSTPRIEPFPPLADDIALLKEVLPSWIGVRFGPVAKSARADRGLLAGASLLRAVYPDSPASEAGLEAGDIILGPPERDFDAPGQFREWTMTSPRETPLPLRVLRPGTRPDNDQGFNAMVVLRPFLLKLPELPGPPQIGDVAPALPAGLKPVGVGSLPNLDGRSRLLFFWATWCGPCKGAVPEVMAFAAERGVPVLAISDESADRVSGFVRKREKPFFEHVAVDPLRKSFIAYGVSGTPTILLIDGGGVVRHLQVGHAPKEGLTIDGWNWSGPSKPAR